MKSVNIDLIKPSGVSVPEYDDVCTSSTSDSDSGVPAKPLQVGGHRLQQQHQQELLLFYFQVHT